MSIEDNLYHYLKYYQRSPKWFKILVAKIYNSIPIRKRIGIKYLEFRKLISESNFWNEEQIFEYQNKEFMQTLSVAKQTVFYPKFYHKLGISFDDIKSLLDIKYLPMIDKKILQKERENMVVNHKNKKSIYITTGGTTGQQVGFYLEKGVSRPKELAFIENMWSRVGYNKKSKSAVIRGEVINFNSENNISKMDYLRNWLLLSSYHINEQNLDKYLKALNDFGPEFIQGYPSALTTLAKLMNNFHISLNKNPQALFLGSENLYDHQKQELKRAFKCRLFSWYGHSEKLVLGGYCAYDECYHIFPQYGFMEIIDKKDNVIKEGKGEIVGTSFHNGVMPLIRYKTGDIATLTNKVCKCNRYYAKLSYVEGRKHEFILTGDNRKISMTALNMHLPVFDCLENFQFYQDKKGEATLYYKSFNNLLSKQEEKIKKELLNKLGREFILNLEHCRKFKLSPSGKQTYLIQKLKF